MGHAASLAFFSLLPFLTAGGQSNSVPPPDLHLLQQQVIMLTARIDSTGYLITAALLLPIAVACLVLWWNARRFPTFGSVGLYRGAVTCASGELFGFDRTRAISIQSAEEIAAAAKVYGQQDDITVLRLAFAPAEVVHA